MCGLDVVRMIVPPGAAHSFGILVIRHDIVVVTELDVADGAGPILLDNLAIQNFRHLRWRS